MDFILGKLLEFWKSMVKFATKIDNEFRQKLSKKNVLIDFNFIFVIVFVPIYAK